MEVYENIIGPSDAPDTAKRLHRLDHEHAVDYLVLPRADLARRRLRTRTEAGREVAVALPRDMRLFDGAVLALSDDAALVVRVEAEEWLRLKPRDAQAALKLGYHTGNLHWRVRFDGLELHVALETEIARYRDRLAEMVGAGEVEDLGIKTVGGA